MLLVQEAADSGELGPEALARALYATSALIEPGSGTPAAPTGLADWLGYFARSGAYSALRPPLQTIAQAYSLWIDQAQRPEIRERKDFCDLKTWLHDAHGLDASEQLGIGILGILAARLLDRDADLGARSVLAADFLGATSLAGREDQLCGLAVADRAWYREQLAGTCGDDLTWERRPFEQRPLLALERGPVLIVSSQALWTGWVRACTSACLTSHATAASTTTSPGSTPR